MSNHPFVSPLRYPGGKGSLANFIKSVMDANQLYDGAYVEVYAGGAGIAWSLLLRDVVKCVHINDISEHIYAFWYSVFNCTDELCRKIRDIRVSMSEWRLQKVIYENPEKHDIFELGFSTFFLNRTNRSGIISGGVIGGKKQTGKWKLNARFNKKDLIHRIERLARYKSKVKLYRLDGAKFMREELPKLGKSTLVYCDPPYYMKGKDLYDNHYIHEDHLEIAKLIQMKIKQPWIVSYDSQPQIMQLYQNRPHIKYCLNYRAQKRYKGHEVMFFSKNLKLPNDLNQKLHCPN